MRIQAVRSLAILALAIAASACAKNPTIAIPPPPPAKTAVGNPAFTGGTYGVAVYQPPLAAGSTPVFTLAAANGLPTGTSGTASDPAGNLYVLSDQSQTIFIFNHPITSTSMPAIIMGPFAPFVNAFEMTRDAQGNLWVSSSNTNTVYVFSPPFATGVPVPSLTMTSPQFNFPAAISFDRAGNMYIAQDLGPTVAVYTPPFFAGQVAAANMKIGVEPTAAAIDVKGRMFVSDFATGNVLVINPPFGTGTPAVAFTISPPVVSGGTSGEANFVTFDSSGNLYVAYQSDGANGNVSVFAPPFAGTSTPVFSLPQSGGPYSVSFGL